MDNHDFAILTHITNPTLFNKVASELLSQPCKPSPFDLLEFQLQHQAKLQEIRSNPIVLKLGLYECSLDTEGIHYFKWSKKQREFVDCTVREPLLTSDISGGKGNRLVWVYRNEIVYRDKDGNEFTELDYWDREEMTREEWLKGESIC